MRRVIAVRKEPKMWSIGLLVAAVLWFLGDKFFDLGTNPWYLIGILVFSFLVDRWVTGSSSEEGMYIE